MDCGLIKAQKVGTVAYVVDLRDLVQSSGYKVLPGPVRRSPSRTIPAWP